ncbi:MAG: 30S ribosomal protein S6 [Verrucomicrobiaceae bacterium]|nr:30S ribosomal protein S6 [Verrucomicrobiaceae bacterium]
MKHKYEAMIVFDTKGKEEGIDTLVSTVSKEMEKAGAKLEQIDNLGKRQFPSSPRHVEAGTFVNIRFEAESSVLDAIQAKLKLNDNVYQQFYLRAAAK